MRRNTWPERVIIFTVMAAVLLTVSLVVTLWISLPEGLFSSL